MCLNIGLKLPARDESPAAALSVLQVALGRASRSRSRLVLAVAGSARADARDAPALCPRAALSRPLLHRTRLDARQSTCVRRRYTSTYQLMFIVVQSEHIAASLITYSKIL